MPYKLMLLALTLLSYSCFAARSNVVFRREKQPFFSMADPCVMHNSPNRASITTPLGQLIIHGILTDLVQRPSYQQLALNYAELISIITPVSQVSAAAEKREVFVGGWDQCWCVLAG